MYLENKPVTTITEYFESEYPSLKRTGEGISFFTSADDEYNSLRNGIGIKLQEQNILIEMTGKDVLDFLHRVTTNSIIDVKPLEVRNTLFLNEKGKFIDKTNFISYENNYLLIGSRDDENRLINWINKFIITEDIVVNDVSDKFKIFELLGKQSESFVTMLFGKEKSDLPDGKLRRCEVDGFHFDIFLEKLSKNLSSYKIIIEKEKSVEFLRYLFSIKSVFDLSLTGDDAYNLLRIVNGIPSYPSEINDGVNPHEINLIENINFKKGCYIGQEVIARLDTYDKVQRKMMLIKTNNSIDVQMPAMIYNADGIETGEITSLENSNQNHMQYGLALMKKKMLDNSHSYYFNGGGKKNFIEISEFECNS